MFWVDVHLYIPIIIYIVINLTLEEKINLNIETKKTKTKTTILKIHLGLTQQRLPTVDSPQSTVLDPALSASELLCSWPHSLGCSPFPLSPRHLKWDPMSGSVCWLLLLPQMFPQVSTSLPPTLPSTLNYPYFRRPALATPANTALSVSDFLPECLMFPPQSIYF